MRCPLCEGTGDITLRDKTEDEIRRLVSSGLSYQRVADILGMSKSRVYYHARKMNVRPRYRPELISNFEARDVLAQRDLPEL